MRVELEVGLVGCLLLLLVLLLLLLLLGCELLLCCLLGEGGFDQVERVRGPPARVFEGGEGEAVLECADELGMVG